MFSGGQNKEEKQRIEYKTEFGSYWFKEPTRDSLCYTKKVRGAEERA